MNTTLKLLILSEITEDFAWALNEFESIFTVKTCLLSVTKIKTQAYSLYSRHTNLSRTVPEF